MIIDIIETPTHVLQLEMTPDTPGRCRRRLTVSVLSGPPLTTDQVARIRDEVVRDLEAAGGRVFRVVATEEEP